MSWFADLDPEPAGFPDCGRCAYVSTGPWYVCYTCANSTIASIAPRSCPVCCHRLNPWEERCRNRVCSWPTRSLSRVDAISTHSGALKDCIIRYKRHSKWAWALIFGRLLYGHLEQHYAPGDVDLILANPTWAGPGSNNEFQHTERVVAEAARWDIHQRWNFDTSDPRAVILTDQPPQSVQGSRPTWEEKFEVANARKQLLLAPDPNRLRGARIVVYDDVTTTLLQQEFLAEFLREHGAADVWGVVLARAEFGS